MQIRVKSPFISNWIICLVLHLCFIDNKAIFLICILFFDGLLCQDGEDAINSHCDNKTTVTIGESVFKISYYHLSYNGLMIQLQQISLNLILI